MNGSDEQAILKSKEELRKEVEGLKGVFGEFAKSSERQGYIMIFLSYSMIFIGICQLITCFFEAR